MNDRQHASLAVNRRSFLRATAGAAVAATAAGTLPGRARAAPSLEEWFSNVSNFSGVVDERGSPRVTVQVGAPGNGGGFAFEPAAVRVDPGTTVVWEWTGEGGAHDVTATEDAYGSDLVDEAGYTFEHTFEEGVSTYFCTPHEAMGMKGAVVVGDVEVAEPDTRPTFGFVEREPDYGDWFDGVDIEGTRDARGRQEVRIHVGTVDGALRFDPPAVHVSPGTRVVWEWVDDRTHALVAEDGSYESPAQSAGEFGLVFDGDGVSKYGCVNHDGMRGAIVVGDPFEGTIELTAGELTVLGGFAGTIGLVGLAGGLAFWKGRSRRSE